MTRLAQISVICILAGGAIGYMSGSVYWLGDTLSMRERGGIVRHSPGWEKRSEKNWQNNTGANSKNALNKLIIRLRYEMEPEDWQVELAKLEEACGDFRGDEGRRAALILLTRWMEVNPREAVAIAKRLKIKDGEVPLMLHWASFDVESAAAYLKEDRELLYSGRSQELVEYFAKMWAVKDPDKAWAWLTGEWEPCYTFIEGIIDRHPARVREFVDKFPLDYWGNPPWNVRESLIKAWTHKDMPETLRWVESLPEKNRNDYRQLALLELAKSDWELAEVLLHRWGESISEETIAAMSSKIKDDWDAMTWFMKNQAHGTPLPPERIRAWTGRDPDEVKRWLNNMPEGKARELAVKNYLTALTGKDYGRALNGTELLRDAEAGLREMSNIIREWKMYDKKAAQKWVESYEGTSRAEMVLKRALEGGVND